MNLYWKISSVGVTIILTYIPVRYISVYLMWIREEHSEIAPEKYIFTSTYESFKVIQFFDFSYLENVQL